MNRLETIHIRLLTIRLGLIMLLFTICRILFIFFNLDSFSGITFSSGLSTLWYGWRFDISAIFYINSLWILLHIVPFNIRFKPAYQKMLKWLFFLVNVPALFINITDIAYFRYSHKRTTTEIISYAGDFIALLPEYLTDYWYHGFILISLILALVWAYEKFASLNSPSHSLNRVVQFILFLIVGGLTFLGMRGGFQQRPINPINAFQMVEPELVAIVTNSPFHIIYSFEHQDLREKKYFNASSLLQEFSLVRNEVALEPGAGITCHDTVNAPNIMIIVLESFSPSFMGLYGAEKSATPFLDSLSNQAIIFKNMFANGMRSVESIPSICASLPSIGKEDFMESVYHANEIQGLGSILKNMGYHTSFFHGGNEGTFNIESMAKQCGFEHYLDRGDYGNDQDFDGNWGIFDGPFFEFTANQLHDFQEPFASVLFSLSSHHPYTIPEDFIARVKDEKKEILKSVRYTDHSLAKFFQKASSMPWFENTLFVITADHHGPVTDPEEYNCVNLSRVPLLLYMPGKPISRTITDPVQQIDIMPMVLDYLDYEVPYCAFGSSPFLRTEAGYAFNYLNGFHQIIDSNYVLQFNDDRPFALFNYKNDPRLKENIIVPNPQVKIRMVKRLRAVIQTYNEAMIENTLAYDRFVEKRQKPAHKTIAMGHGGMGIASLYPINSMQSIQKCMDLGMDGTEIDVQMTKDGNLIAFHDKDLSKRTNLTGVIHSKSMEELENCHYTSIPILNYKVITLNEIFNTFRGMTGYEFSLDCKLYPANSDQESYRIAFANALIEIINQHELKGRVYIESNNVDFLRILKERDAELMLYIYPENFETGLQISLQEGFRGITISNRNLSADQVKLAHENNLKIATWNTHSRKDNSEAIAKKADIIQTDKVPDLLRKLN